MAIVKGDINKINLSTSRFRQIIEDGSLIEDKRYGVDISGDKKLIKIGVAVSGKLCKVACR